MVLAIYTLYGVFLRKELWRVTDFDKLLTEFNEKQLFY